MNKKYIIIFLIIISILGIFLVSNLSVNKNEYVTYNEFIKNVEDKKVENVTIQNDKVEFKCFENETIYETENPESTDFKKYLLEKDIKINDSFNDDDFAYIFDLIFYGIFFGAIGFGIYKITSFSRNTFKVIKKNNTRFTDIAGMEEVKKDMLKTVDMLKNPLKYKEKGLRPPKGIILEGPPGNGKTLFARALAGEANMNFIATKGADFQSTMMSIGPRKIKTLFKKARKNSPCIIFIDEFDGIGERRNYAGTGIDKENNRMIISMLNEMDGFKEESGVLVLAATNSYASLDAALVRPGRFDKKYKIDNPDYDTILELIKLYTKNKTLDESIKVDALAKCFEKLSCAAIETILNEAATIAEFDNRNKITLQDIVKAGEKTNTIRIKIK